MPPSTEAQSAIRPTEDIGNGRNTAQAYEAFVSPPAQLFTTAARLGAEPAYWVRQEDGWQATSWATYAQEVSAAACALSDLGIRRGDSVAILSFNCPQWSITAYAALCLGAIPVGIYWTSSGADIEYILNHCKATVLVVEDAQRMQRIAEIADKLPHLKVLVQIKGSVATSAVAALTTLDWAGFMGSGQSGGPISPGRLQQGIASIQPQDTATLIYTSGTTGPSKAVALTHGNLWWVANTLQSLFGANEHDRMLSYLPLAHIAEQMGTMHNQVYSGFAVYYARSIEQLADHLKEVRPTVFFGVPRVWEKMQIALESKLAEAKGVKARLVTWAMQVGQRWHALGLDDKPQGLWLGAQMWLARRLVFTKVQRAMGFDAARLLSTGAAPISPESLRFFTGLDLVVRELYGQSEACGPSTLSLAGTTRIGSVGRPLPGTEIHVAQDGELLIRGPHIFKGYVGQPTATAQTLQDGWLLTGDLGRIDEDGYVYITGRKKDLIITSGGKNISPANIEAALMDAHLIEFAVVCGDGRHYLTALLTLEPQSLAEFAQAHGLSGPNLHEHPKVLEALQQAVDHVNEQQARVAHIRKFAVLTRPLSIEGGELTPTLKVKRKVVLEREQALINRLYEN